MSKNGRKEGIVKGQMGLFEEAKVESEQPQPPTTVRIGKREARVPLYKKRREALEKLKTLLAELEGKDVYNLHFPYQTET